MATRFTHSYKPEVGFTVYESHSPVRCGIIIELLDCKHDSPDFWIVNVLWKNGTQSSVPVNMLNCYRSLYQEHQRKADRMAGVMAELQDMKVNRDKRTGKYWNNLWN